MEDFQVWLTLPGDTMQSVYVCAAEDEDDAKARALADYPGSEIGEIEPFYDY